MTEALAAWPPCVNDAVCNCHPPQSIGHLLLTIACSLVICGHLASSVVRGRRRRIIKSDERRGIAPHDGGEAVGERLTDSAGLRLVRIAHACLQAPQERFTLDTTVVPSAIHWFSHSRRFVAGQPDTRYGWANTPQGPVIIKCLDAALASNASTLLDNEQVVLRALAQRRAPVPACLSAEELDASLPKHALATRFSGLSLQLAGSGQLPAADAVSPARLTGLEQLSAWIHFLQRAPAFIDATAVPLDIWAGNLVLPMTHMPSGEAAHGLASGTAGQLRLHEPVLIDHAHTAWAGAQLRRPMWLHAGMARIPPELRPLLQADQEALRSLFAARGAPLPGEAPTVGLAVGSQTAGQTISQKLWAEYSAPQSLQKALDSGDVNRAAALEYAVGVALAAVLDAPGDELARRRPALGPIVARMTSASPTARYGRIADVADALAQAAGPLPVVSQARWAAVTPASLSRALSRPSQRTQMPGAAEMGGLGRGAGIGADAQETDVSAAERADAYCRERKHPGLSDATPGTVLPDGRNPHHPPVSSLSAVKPSATAHSTPWLAYAMVAAGAFMGAWWAI
jgi:hypothetical protein